MPPTRAELLLAYRHVYKALLRAVQYSKPARYVARDRVRDAFRNQPIEHFDAARLSRTLEFLNGATKVRGLEHKILKNLMHVQWQRQMGPRRVAVYVHLSRVLFLWSVVY